MSRVNRVLPPLVQCIANCNGRRSTVVIDDGRTDGSGHLPGSRNGLLESLRSLPVWLPGTASDAPKRNVIVLLCYLFTCVLAFGLLWTVF